MSNVVPVQEAKFKPKGVGMVNWRPKWSRKKLYGMLARHTPKAIATVVELLESPNHNVRLGAAKLIASKTLPDLQSLEVEGELKSQVTVNVVRAYLQDTIIDATVKRKLLNKPKSKAKSKGKKQA